MVRVDCPPGVDLIKEEEEEEINVRTCPGKMSREWSLLMATSSDGVVSKRAAKLVSVSLLWTV